MQPTMMKNSVAAVYPPLLTTQKPPQKLYYLHKELIPLECFIIKGNLELFACVIIQNYALERMRSLGLDLYILKLEIIISKFEACTTLQSMIYAQTQSAKVLDLALRWKNVLLVAV